MVKQNKPGASRSFNTVEIDQLIVIKKSKNQTKIRNESWWLQNIEDSLKQYHPQFLGEDQDEQGDFFYRIEYLSSASLSDLLLLGELGTETWASIFKCCDGYLKALSLASEKVEAPVSLDSKFFVESFLIPKTQRRLNSFLDSKVLKNFNQTEPVLINGKTLPSLEELIADLYRTIRGQAYPTTFMHGDFCFSNIVFDSQKKWIRCFDPRGGLDDDKPSLWGSVVYDVSKLAHSALGLYDLIIANQFQVRQSGQDFQLTITGGRGVEIIQNQFVKNTYAGIDPMSSAVLGNMILQFFAMLPLHQDSEQRQLGFFAQGLALYEKFFIQPN